ncbi:glycosyltransferase family 2 protein [Dinoroseobacter sp. S76]|uniref:glycosyltransferase family 2 protein n=1 Tax=Dinoroseobacter sp. S76 TaxID=3415124 RepID=UPI003C7A698E
MISVIIPCHNEELVLGALLSSLAGQSGLPRAHGSEIIVVANACSDKTCAVAEAARPQLEQAGYTLQVIDLPEPGKARALNIADGRARFAPRLYVDADVTLGAEVLAQLRPLLLSDAPVYCSARIEIAPARSWVSRAYGRFMLAMPFVRDGVPGMGLYGVSAPARGRWGAFPIIHSDDRFVRLQFTPAERRKVPAPYRWPVPDGLVNLIKVRLRWNEGNREFTRLYPELLINDGARNDLRAALRTVISHPVDGIAYISVFISTAIWAQFKRRDSAVVWRRGRPMA